MSGMINSLLEALTIGALYFAFSIPFIIIGVIVHKKREKFYKEVANKYGLVYKEGQQINLMRSFRSRLFKYNRTIKTSGVFEGKHQGHTFFIFANTFYARSSSKVFTIGSCEFGTTEFPHILLKSKKMPLYQEPTQKDRIISIEPEHLIDFDLYCPEDYEIEVLQIFTQPLLRSIQSISEKFSIEFEGNSMYIYINKNIQNKRNVEDIGKMIEIIKEIIHKTDGLLIRLKDDFEVLDEYYKK